MAVEQRADLTFPPALKETEIGLLPEDWQVVGSPRGSELPWLP